jgi:hypothetical protein
MHGKRLADINPNNPPRHFLKRTCRYMTRPKQDIKTRLNELIDKYSACTNNNDNKKAIQKAYRKGMFEISILSRSDVHRSSRPALSVSRKTRNIYYGELSW